MLDLAALRLTRHRRSKTATSSSGAMVTLQDVDRLPRRLRRPPPGCCPRPAARSRPRGWSAAWPRWAASRSTARHDSEVVAALLALNAVFVVGPRATDRWRAPPCASCRSPRRTWPAAGCVTSLFIPGAPRGRGARARGRAALGARAGGGGGGGLLLGRPCSRARIAVTGLDGPPGAGAGGGGAPRGHARARTRTCERGRGAGRGARRLPRRRARLGGVPARRVARVLAAPRAAPRHRAGARPAAEPAPRCRAAAARAAAQRAALLHLRPHGDDGQRRAAPRCECEARTTLLDLLRRERPVGRQARLRDRRVRRLRRAAGRPARVLAA